MMNCTRTGYVSLVEPHAVDAMDSSSIDETAQLIPGPTDTQKTHPETRSPKPFMPPVNPVGNSPNDGVTIDTHINRLLPIAFTSAFAIAATSATTLYAYASITCADPTHCRDEEQSRYASIVAFAVTTANIFGMFAVFVLRQWTEYRPKVGLCFWLICRGLGMAILAVGGELNMSVPVM